MVKQIRAKNKRLDYFVRNDKSENTEKMMEQFREMLPMWALYWDKEAEAVEENLPLLVESFDTELKNVADEKERINSLFDDKMTPLQEELSRIKMQIKELETNRSQELMLNLRIKSKLIDDRQQMVDKARMDVRDRCYQDVYERMVYLALMFNVPVQGMISADDVSKVLKRFSPSN